MTTDVKYLTLTDENFELEVLQSHTLVMVDFWAVWCGPCRIMNPVIAAIAEQFLGKVKVGKLNADDYEQLATRYHIEAIPTLLFFYQGQIVDRLAGVVSESALSDRLHDLLKHDAPVESSV
ncbi:MAG: thioredoxin [Oscillatoriales cyanobacterium RM1_1_9]|nr:thioredoxin [Oscillatoriales cyanobacterium SM2_3_0]NJO45189.1 thioredoxin [Oscillatoriales cyanobacterium RM2_1_1]NJO71247.1 thioredoxin [Oscillatoriales cyanobacterium RM1_1_9]